MSNELITATAKKVMLYGQPTSMTLGLPGLLKKIESEIKGGMDKTALYVFVSKNFKRIKLFYWDKNGYAMWYKHVKAGVFVVERRDGYKVITAVNLKALLGSKLLPSTKK